jgi:hypothetical protein
MNVTYTDSWYWDIVMYLRSMDIRFYKAPGPERQNSFTSNEL